jgi:hypothetical protein
MRSQQVEPGPDLSFPNIHFAEVFGKPPVPHVPANTLFFDAGPLSIGIEYRLLSEEILTQVYGAERAAQIVAERFGNPEVQSETESFNSGVSIHVFDASSGVEHLRFDDLDAKKHYHYLRSDGHHAVVWFDDIANGDLVSWALASLRDRAGTMLELAGAHDLAARVDRDALARVLPEVEAAARAQAVQPAICRSSHRASVGLRADPYTNPRRGP